MSVRRDKRIDPATGAMREYWIVDVDYEFPDGSRKRIKKVPPIQTRRGAEQYERELRQALADGSYGRKEAPTLDEWFHGYFWREWVIARQNKPSEREAKESIYALYLGPMLGKCRLDQIGEQQIAGLRARMVKLGRSPKRINNVLTVLSKALRYAQDARVIDRAPKVGLLKTERPEIMALELEEYAHLLATAKTFELRWYVAACLAGEAGLRNGEIRELRWAEDIDLVAETITVNRQSWRGVIGSPKGGRRRTVPMNPALSLALRCLPEPRRGYVIRNADGTPTTEGQTQWAIRMIYDLAKLPRRGWHALRHSFGTHAALFGANPWRLQAWMGHRRIDETMLYVHVAEIHRRPIPPAILKEGARESDPDRRILEMLGARGHLTATEKEEESKRPDLQLVR
jgi:integrase